MTKEELMADGAYILEQEGWLIDRAANSEYGAGNRRLMSFSERYVDWQRRVKEFRQQNPGVWPEPPDNS
ncbi:hypothetical protein M0R72_02960 [Candidatus Pacearchaeota archaeon]|nr:hypothetical protein [Candidatus Pacearchaeota archaeon]